MQERLQHEAGLGRGLGSGVSSCNLQGPKTLPCGQQKPQAALEQSSAMSCKSLMAWALSLLHLSLCSHQQTRRAPTRTQGQADVPVLIAPKCSECFVVVVTEGSEDDKGGGHLLSPASPSPAARRDTATPEVSWPQGLSSVKVEQGGRAWTTRYWKNPDND